MRLICNKLRTFLYLNLIITLPEAFVVVGLFCAVFITGSYNVPLVAAPSAGDVIFTSSFLFVVVVPMPTLPYF